MKSVLSKTSVAGILALTNVSVYAFSPIVVGNVGFATTAGSLDRKLSIAFAPRQSTNHIRLHMSDDDSVRNFEHE